MFSNADIDTIRVYVQADPGVDFLIDTSSLKEIIPDPNWKEEAQERIQELRMSLLQVQVNIGEQYEPADIQIHVW